MPSACWWKGERQRGKTEPQGKTCKCNMRVVFPNLVSGWEAPVTPWERENNLHCCPSCTQPPPAAVAPQTCRRAWDTRLVLCGTCSVLELCQCIPLRSLSSGTWWGCSGPTCNPRKLASQPCPTKPAWTRDRAPRAKFWLMLWSFKMEFLMEALEFFKACTPPWFPSCCFSLSASFSLNLHLRSSS